MNWEVGVTVKMKVWCRNEGMTEEMKLEDKRREKKCRKVK